MASKSLTAAVRNALSVASNEAYKAVEAGNEARLVAREKTEILAGMVRQGPEHASHVAAWVDNKFSTEGLDSASKEAEKIRKQKSRFLGALRAHFDVGEDTLISQNGTTKVLAKPASSNRAGGSKPSGKKTGAEELAAKLQQEKEELAAKLKQAESKPKGVHELTPLEFLAAFKRLQEKDSTQAELVVQLISHS